MNNFTVGQHVIHSFGEGKITEINGDLFTVQFYKGETRIVSSGLEPTETLDQLRTKFHSCWIRGAEWRLEVGQLLYQIKQRCAHGAWGEFLAQYDLSRSTADDYVRRYEDQADITEPRQFEIPNRPRTPILKRKSGSRTSPQSRRSARVRGPRITLPRFTSASKTVPRRSWSFTTPRRRRTRSASRRSGKTLSRQSSPTAYRRKTNPRKSRTS